MTTPSTLRFFWHSLSAVFLLPLLLLSLLLLSSSSSSCFSPFFFLITAFFPHPLTCRDMVHAHESSPNVGIVHQVPTTETVTTFADVIEQVYFATQHARMYLLFVLVDENCVNGMSILFSKSTLKRLSGKSWGLWVCVCFVCACPSVVLRDCQLFTL